MKLNLSEATRLQACIVDLDGTLVDTLGDFEVALNHMLATLDRPPVTRTVIGQLVGKGSEHLIRSVLAHGERQRGVADSVAPEDLVNRAFSTITGYARTEVIGQNPRMFQSGRHDRRFYAEMWATIHAHGRWQGEVWNRRKTGEVFPQWLSITAVHSPQGDVTHYVATFSDITHQKQNEERIQLLAFSDPLTSLPNRRLLLDRLEHALIVSTRNQRRGGPGDRREKHTAHGRNPAAAQPRIRRLVGADRTQPGPQGALSAAPGRSQASAHRSSPANPIQSPLPMAADGGCA